MLSVKQISTSGIESVFEASRVSYVPTGNGKLETLFTENADGSTNSFLAGKYYIMNESGKTVAKYDLGPEPKGEGE